jgi:hypothetical protein
MAAWVTNPNSAINERLILPHVIGITSKTPTTTTKHSFGDDWEFCHNVAS